MDMIAQHKGPAYVASRMLGFAAQGLPIKASLLDVCNHALDNEPELAGRDTGRARHVFGLLARGVIPEQVECLQARQQIDALRQQAVQRDQHHDNLPAPRG